MELRTPIPRFPLQSVLVNLAFFLTFFPSLIDFAIPSQTQPLAAFAALPLLALYPVRLNRTTTPALIGVAVVCCYIAGSLLVFPQIALSILSNGATYIMGPLLLVALWGRLDKLSPWPLRIALIVWCVVGCVQALPFPGEIKHIFEVILRPLVSNDRFTMDIYSGGKGGRGVILLASEPSISAPTVIYFGLAALFLYDFRRIGRLELRLSFLLVALLIAFNRSGNVFVLLALALAGAAMGVLARQSLQRRLLFSVASASLAVIAVAGLMIVPTEVRGLVVLQQIVSGLFPFNGWGDLYGILCATAGQRILQLSYGYGSLIDNSGLGHGIASWSIDRVFDQIMTMVDIPAYDIALAFAGDADFQMKPAAYFAVIAFDTGLLGLLPMLWTVGSIFFRPKSNVYKRKWVFVLPAVAWLFVFITAGLLSPWVMLCFAVSPLEASLTSGRPHSRHIGAGIGSGGSSSTGTDT